MLRHSLILCLAALAAQAGAGDTGSLWLRPDVSGQAAEIVIRRSQPGPMPFTITSGTAQVLDESFRVIGPFGVPVYTIPGAPHFFGQGETSITATSLVLVPGEYRIRFGGQGLYLRVTVPGSPLVLSGFRFGSDPALMAEPVSASYTFHVPPGTTSFGIVPDVPGTQADDYLAVEVRDDTGATVVTYACGADASPHPAPCARIPINLTARESGAYWQLSVVHNGSAVVALDTIPSVLSIRQEDWFLPHAFVIDPERPGGRDCASLGGDWDAIEGRCVVQDWWFQPADTLLLLESATLVFEGEVRNGGTIDNRGTLINEGQLLSTATVRNQGRFVNRGTLINDGTTTNPGSFENHGLLTGAGLFNNSGVLTNFCSGTIDDSVTLVGNEAQPDGMDADGDGVCQKADCAPDDPAWWSPPAEVRSLRLTRDDGPASAATLTWLAPQTLGGTGVVYDVLRSDFADFPGASSCVVGDNASLHADDPADPLPGQAWFYLVIAENGCGHGAAGYATGGLPRAASGCR